MLSQTDCLSIVCQFAINSRLDIFYDVNQSIRRRVSIKAQFKENKNMKVRLGGVGESTVTTHSP